MFSFSYVKDLLLDVNLAFEKKVYNDKINFFECDRIDFDSEYQFLLDFRMGKSSNINNKNGKLKNNNILTKSLIKNIETDEINKDNLNPVLEKKKNDDKKIEKPIIKKFYI